MRENRDSLISLLVFSRLAASYIRTILYHCPLPTDPPMQHERKEKGKEEEEEEELSSGVRSQT